MAVFFLFLRNVLLPIEILKIKILEHSDPPSQHFSVHKAFSHSFFCRGKVMLCHPAEWHKCSSVFLCCFSLTIFVVFVSATVVLLLLFSFSAKMAVSDVSQKCYVITSKI